MNKRTWKLISPDGKEFIATSPIKCVLKELDSRVSKEIQMKRLAKMLLTCNLCEEGESKYTIGAGTPAEIAGICETCFQTILSDCQNINGQNAGTGKNANW